MTKILFGFRAPVVLLALFVLFSVPVQAETAAESAHRHYVRGLEAARRGDLRSAKAEFETAFRESPHFAVRFNLGKVCFELGELADARAHFDAYLTEGAASISAERRKEVERALRELDARIAIERPNSTAPAEVPAPPREALSRSPTAERVAPKPAVDPGDDGSELQRARRRMLAYALGGTGGALLVSGAVVLVWNEGRLSDAKQTRAELLDAAPPTEIRTEAELAEVIAYERAVVRNQATLEATKDFRAVGFTLAGVGTVLVASGVVLFLTSRSDVGVRVQAGIRSVALSGAW